MAENKRRHRYDYLNNYKQDVSGQYRYTGDHYLWVSDRKASLRKMWLCSGLQVLLVALGGLMPKAGMEGRFFSLLPFVVAAIFVFVQIYCIGNLAMIKKEIKIL